MPRVSFLANVSHEIRSPLNGVLMMASLLRDSDLSEEQKELLGVVMFSAQTIDRLIRDLTDLTQIRTGKFTVHNDTFDFSELVRHLVDINRPEATRKGLELVSDIGPKLDYLYGDRERIGQIIANLLINAVKYTDRGHVRMDAVEEDGNLVISVEDTGIGIPEGQQQAVFNLFHQGLHGDGRRVDGTGIGLAVVKELTEIMNGRVSLMSRYGEGSRFTVILPLQEPSADQRQSDREATDAFLPESARILVVGGRRGQPALYPHPSGA
jgi:signal transduction histidine kinase